MREELWLMCYEAGMRGWAGFNSVHISADSHFKELKALNVSFYDEEASSKLMFTVQAGVLWRAVGHGERGQRRQIQRERGRYYGHAGVGDLWHQ